MAGAAHADERGGMDIAEQKSTFHQFLVLCLWGSLHIIMAVALLTVAFAMGFGWFTGVATYAIIGVLAGLALRMSGAWWVFVVGSTLLLGAGGLVSLLFG